jgi:pimeloyl-ACP methyl ester carboxylesterase
MPKLPANGIELDYDTFGASGDPCILLIMGFSVQKIAWDEAFCQLLADEGFFVVRFDNRDIGLSSKISDGPLPDLAAALAGDFSSCSYHLEDMADDAAGLLEGLGIDAAHVVGASMGGMVAQALALRHPESVWSLCSIMSTTGDRSVGQPRPEAMGALLTPPPQTREEAMERAVRVNRVIGSPSYPANEAAVKQRAGRAWDRNHDPVGVARQLLAIMAQADRTEALGHLRVPALVVHGEADPLVDVTGGRATAAAIPDARLVVIPGMGHDLPVELWPQIVTAILDNAARAATPAA